MAQVIFNIPNADLPAWIDAFCSIPGREYQAVLGDPLGPDPQIQNPETRAQYAKRTMIAILKSIYVDYKVSSLRAANAAAEAAAAQTAQAVDIS